MPRIRYDRSGEETKRKHRALLASAYRRLLAVPSGTVVNAEEWYCHGYGTAMHVLAYLSMRRRPRYKIIADTRDNTIAERL